MRSETTAWPPNTRGQDGVKVFAYHEFGQGVSRDVYELTPAVFRSHLMMIRRITSKGTLSVQVTFDDAHVSQAEIAVPMMEEFTFRGIFFVPAAWVGVKQQTMTWEQLRGLIKNGHLIGSHSLTHALLTKLTSADLMNELVRSRCLLEDRLGVPVYSISMPGGRWTRQVAAACFEAGYREVYTSDPTVSVINLQFRNRERIAIIGRLAVRRSMNHSTLAGYATGGLAASAWLKSEYQIKQSLKQILGDSSYQAIWRRMLRSPLRPHEHI